MTQPKNKKTPKARQKMNIKPIMDVTCSMCQYLRFTQKNGSNFTPNPPKFTLTADLSLTYPADLSFCKENRPKCHLIVTLKHNFGFSFLPI